MTNESEAICQEIIDYLEAPCDLVGIWVQNEVDKAEAAKQGKFLCLRDECPNYVRRDNDGYGWRDCGCGLSDNGKYLTKYKVCPYKQTIPFRYDPFKNFVGIQPKGFSVKTDDGEDVTIMYTIGQRIKQAVDEVYKDWDDN